MHGGCQRRRIRPHTAAAAAAATAFVGSRAASARAASRARLHGTSWRRAWLAAPPRGEETRNAAVHRRRALLHARTAAWAGTTAAHGRRALLHARTAEWSRAWLQRTGAASCCGHDGSAARRGEETRTAAVLWRGVAHGGRKGRGLLARRRVRRRGKGLSSQPCMPGFAGHSLEAASASGFFNIMSWLVNQACGATSSCRCGAREAKAVSATTSAACVMGCIATLGLRARGAVCGGVGKRGMCACATSSAGRL